MAKPPSITAETAADILEHHFGKRPQKVRRVHGGLANHVFEGCLGREELIIRISDDPVKLQVFMKEQWAVSAARKNKVPTPEILEVCNDIIGLPYMVSRKVSGRPAGTVGRKRNAVIEELGHYAAIINSIPTRDFGHIFNWSPNKLSRNRTWPEYLDKELRLSERLETLRRGQMLDARHLRELRRQVQLMRQWKDGPRLSHGDMRLKNVILDENRKIRALLDWENCTSNIAPYWELSIALHDLTMDEKEFFLQGYGLNLKDYMTMAPAIKALNVLNYAGVVKNALQQKNQAQLLSLRARLNGTFDLYSL